ncbi:MAG TPA: pitrilysin family protein [Candidatus Krumholzibacteria bacterium]|nr:pitrilysin family protein [Candidatus Krumholzibacteria bacterium]
MRTRRRHQFLLWTLVAAGVLPSAAPAVDTGQIETHQLTNGMKVVFWPDHSIPNLALYTFYRVGSRNERPGITGLSHFFEHMMFLGSKNYGPGEFDRTMEAAGGANNAYTAQDITVYQDWFPATATKTIFELEADRIASLSIDSTSVESERGVVASERRRSVDDNNIRALDEENWAAAYKAHPYQWPVIGWMVDIENWKIGDLETYFRTYYAPNNATLVVVGDFETREMLAYCKQFLEPIARGPAPLPVTTTEPEQKGERRTELRRQAQVASLISSYHIPATAHADYHALRVLETLLLEGESSRLHLRLVERDQLALRVFGGMDYALDPTLFQVFVQVRQGIEASACEQALAAELERLQAEPPAERELRKAKNQLATNFYRQLQTISGKAQLLGTSDVYFGDPKAILDVVSRYEAVGAADIQRLARSYFHKSNRTVSTLVPESDKSETKDTAASKEAGS